MEIYVCISSEECEENDSNEVWNEHPEMTDDSVIEGFLKGQDLSSDLSDDIERSDKWKNVEQNQSRSQTQTEGR